MSEVDTEEKKDSGVEPQDNSSASQNQAEPATSTEVTEEKSELDVAKDKIVELQKQIETLTSENASLNDQVLRRVADFDNYRKRMIQEKQDAFDYANTNLLKDLLDSLDNFDRTVDAAATATDPKSIADGVKMINKSLVTMLEEKYNLVAYGKEGEAFNPDIHEAIGSSNDPVAEPVLKAVYLKGYKLKERVIRHAKVMVSMPDGTVTNTDSNSEVKESEVASKEEAK